EAARAGAAEAGDAEDRAGTAHSRAVMTACATLVVEDRTEAQLRGQDLGEPFQTGREMPQPGAAQPRQGQWPRRGALGCPRARYDWDGCDEGEGREARGFHCSSPRGDRARGPVSP